MAGNFGQATPRGTVNTLVAPGLRAGALTRLVFALSLCTSCGPGRILTSSDSADPNGTGTQTPGRTAAESVPGPSPSIEPFLSNTQRNRDFRIEPPGKTSSQTGAPNPSVGRNGTAATGEQGEEEAKIGTPGRITLSPGALTAKTRITATNNGTITTPAQLDHLLTTRSQGALWLNDLGQGNAVEISFDATVPDDTRPAPCSVLPRLSLPDVVAAIGVGIDLCWAIGLDSVSAVRLTWAEGAVDAPRSISIQNSNWNPKRWRPATDRDHPVRILGASKRSLLIGNKIILAAVLFEGTKAQTTYWDMRALGLGAVPSSAALVHDGENHSVVVTAGERLFVQRNKGNQPQDPAEWTAQSVLLPQDRAGDGAHPPNTKIHLVVSTAADGTESLSFWTLTKDKLTELDIAWQPPRSTP